ncbi:hypothetical protein, partial [Ensifer aridi]|uniref:hypothetical protein n=1 Tax=Ensifer aridi TaxID=1708715 RepID=UPI0015E3A0C9
HHSLRHDRQNPKGIIDEFQEWELSFNREQFTTVFFAEVTGFPTYLITQKENYDIDKLINSGIGLFPANMLKKVPETFHDAMETGKCLAFELHTACGFHTFRVVEAVARKCWDAVSNNKPRPNPQSLGTIARELEKEKLGDDKVAQALRQLTSLHRNPLAHPEAILQADEAGAIVGLARSVISMMLPQIPDQLPTTTAFTQIADALSAVRE